MQAGQAATCPAYFLHTVILQQIAEDIELGGGEPCLLANAQRLESDAAAAGKVCLADAAGLQGNTEPVP